MSANQLPVCPHCQGIGYMKDSDGLETVCPLCNGKGVKQDMSGSNEEVSHERAPPVPTCSELLARTFPRHNTLYGLLGNRRQVSRFHA